MKSLVTKKKTPNPKTDCHPQRLTEVESTQNLRIPVGSSSVRSDSGKVTKLWQVKMWGYLV